MCPVVQPQPVDWAARNRKAARKMKYYDKPIMTLLLTIMLAGMVGCGPYTTDNQYRPGIKSVFVPIWTRGPEVYRRELEMQLSEALVKRIELDTPYKTSTKDRADTELSGKIMRISQQVLSKNPDTGRPRELEVTFVLSFTWKDLRTGKILVERTNFRIADTYIPHEPVSEDFFQGSQAAFSRIARRIVEQMEADW